LAQQLQVYLLAGVVTGGGGGKGRNQAVVIDPEGKEISRYSKMQSFTLGGESDHFVAGNHFVTFQWHEALVAPFICYDLRFPELFRCAAWQRPHLFTVIASWPEARVSHWVTLLQARAIENQAYVAGVNRIGQDPKLSFSGRSLIVNPKGEIIADAGDQEGLISAELNIEELMNYRRDLPFLDDMRPEYVRIANRCLVQARIQIKIDLPWCVSKLSE